MKLFIDFEFTGLHQNTKPISLGIVAEDGREFYAEFTDFDLATLDDWLTNNVIANTLYLQLDHKRTTMPQGHYVGTTREILMYLVPWLRQFDYAELWGDCMAYDWVLFCELFGGALNLPRNIYYIPFDICTLFKMKGIDPDIDRTGFAAEGSFSRDNRCIVLGKSISSHNSLVDARVTKDCYCRLEEL